MRARLFAVALVAVLVGEIASVNGQELASQPIEDWIARYAPGRQEVRRIPGVEAPSDECLQIQRFSTNGDHKLAVDDLQKLATSGRNCPETILVHAEESRRILSLADGLVRQAMDAQERGDLVAARRSLGEALTSYPRYYWVQKMVRDLTSPGDCAELLEQARQARDGNDLPSAVRLTQELIASHPDHGEMRVATVELASQLGLQLFNEGELIMARNLWDAALLLEPSDDRLREYTGQVSTRLRKLDEIKQSGR